jgi:hypothetical protein
LSENIKEEKTLHKDLSASVAVHLNEIKDYQEKVIDNLK